MRGHFTCLCEDKKNFISRSIVDANVRGLVEKSVFKQSLDAVVFWNRPTNVLRFVLFRIAFIRSISSKRNSKIFPGTRTIGRPTNDKSSNISRMDLWPKTPSPGKY